MIRLERIDKSFGTQRVLHGIDLALQPGSVTALIGPSGSGKSTLLRCVNLLEVPEAGALTVATPASTSRRRTGRRATPCSRCAARPAWCSRTFNCFRT